MSSLMHYANRVMNQDEEMVFDWDEAARRIKESGCDYALAGLRDDWGFNGGTIFMDGEPYYSDYTNLASSTDVPELEINGVSSPCYKMQSEVPDWDSYTKWPDSAIKILNEE